MSQDQVRIVSRGRNKNTVEIFRHVEVGEGKRQSITKHLKLSKDGKWTDKAGGVYSVN